MQTTRLAEQAVALLIRRLADPIEEVADAALDALLAYGPHAIDQVRTACADTDPDRAARALRWLADGWENSLRDPEALQAATAALAADDAAVRAQAAATLGTLLQRWNMLHFATRDERAAPQMLRLPELICQACRDADPQVRAAAADALGHSGACSPAQSEAVLGALQEALSDNSSRAVREAAAKSLGLLAKCFMG